MAIRRLAVPFLAAALALAPAASSLAEDNDRQARGVPVAAPAQSTILRQADDYSTRCDVLAIAIARGTEDDELTLQQIASVIGQHTARQDIPYQIFAENGQGAFTNVGFYIRGSRVGEYGLADVLATGIPSMAEKFRVVVSDQDPQTAEENCNSPILAKN